MINLVAILSCILGVALFSRNTPEFGVIELVLVGCAGIGLSLLILYFLEALKSDKKLFIPRPWLFLVTLLLISELLILEVAYPTGKYIHVGLGCIGFFFLTLMTFFCGRLDARRIVLVLLAYVLGGCVCGFFYFSYRVGVPVNGITVPGVMDVFAVVIVWMLITSRSARRYIGLLGLIFCVLALSFILFKILYANKRAPVVVISIMVFMYESFRSEGVKMFVKRFLRGVVGRRVFVAGCGLFLCGLVAAIFVSSTNRLSIHALERGIDGRIAVMSTTIDAVMDRPFFGHGAGALQPGANEAGFRVNKVHNLYLEVSFRQGLIAIFFWSVIWASLFKPKPAFVLHKDEYEFWRSVDALGKSIAVGVAAWGLLSARLDRPEVWMLFGMFLGFGGSKFRSMELNR